MIKLWVLGTKKGRTQATLAYKRPSQWEYNGYHHIGKPDEFDADYVVLDDDIARSLHVRRIPPGRFATYHIGPQRLVREK